MSGDARPFGADPDGWVTYQWIPVADGVALVQKRDGCTRTVLQTRGAARPRDDRWS